MYLERFIIKNFRGIEEIILTFNRGLNVLIGENNAGKTTIIDALRICLSYGNQKRDIYISQSDFFINKNTINNEKCDIEFHLHFHIDIPKEAGWFNDLLSIQEDGSQNLQLHFRYYLDEKERVKYKVWGGTNEGQAIAPEVLFLIYHVHLDALRDSEKCLRPFRGNRLGQLYGNIQIDPDHKTDQEKKKELAKKVHKAVDNDTDWIGHVAKGKEKINEHLKETSFTDNQQQVDISFLPFDFNKLVDNLKIQMPIYSNDLLGGYPANQKHFELYQNGLGYNNLIYTATVLGDLKQRKELQKETYVTLLIEEPEAHLHPQLQNLFFNYLNKLDTEHGFQIFITSHSPTITAKANLRSVIVLQNQANKINALSLTKSGLTEDNHKYLQKFLDVTKSQIFFSNGVILVEGISEALLMKVFSRKVGESYDIEKAGIEIVNINGIAFEHFANLFNNALTEKNLQTRCALITDDDRKEIADNPAARIANVNLLQGGRLKPFIGAITFEYELFLASDANRTLLLKVYKELHPDTVIIVDANIEIYSKNFADKVKKQQAKSELALRLAIHLENGLMLHNAFEKQSDTTNPLNEAQYLATISKVDQDDFADYRSFIVPTYIQNAIKYTVKGE